jgi:hypothetical protein
MLAFNLTYFSYYNFLFLNACLQDLSRRSFITKMLGSFLQVDVNRKETLSIQMLSLNFMDPNSLMTWLEMRKMAFDVGLRFSLRVKSSLTVLVAYSLMMTGFLIAKGFNKLTALDSIFTIYHWIICMA